MACTAHPWYANLHTERLPVAYKHTNTYLPKGICASDSYEHCVHVAACMLPWALLVALNSADPSNYF